MERAGAGQTGAPGQGPGLMLRVSIWNRRETGFREPSSDEAVGRIARDPNSRVNTKGRRHYGEALPNRVAEVVMAGW